VVRFAKALALFAHPDDGEFGFGGTVAKLASEGTEVQYVCVTDGSAGSNEPGVTRDQLRPLRKREQLAACQVLGVTDCTFLDFVDGELELNFDLRRAVTREVRRHRPDVILGPDPTRLWNRSRDYINHRDHLVVGEAVLCAVMPDAPTRLQSPELLDEGFEPFEPPFVWLGAEDGDTCIDITGTIDTKIEALGRHESQLESMPDWAEFVRSRAKEIGAAAGMDYAEAFKVFTLKPPEED
jgi:LmbE family N-acetylglucosaminyl deacetylase